MAIPDFLDSQFNHYDPNQVQDDLGFESLEEDNPLGVNLANAIESIGFKVGACGETPDNLAWVDVIYDGSLPKENLEDGLKKRGFNYVSSEVQAKDEKIVRIYARKMTQVQIISENSLKFGPGNVVADAPNLVANINTAKASKQEKVEAEILDVVGDLDLHKMSSVVVSAVVGGTISVEILVAFMPVVDFIDVEEIVNRLAKAGHRITGVATSAGDIINKLRITIQYRPGWIGEMGMDEEAAEWMKEVGQRREFAIEKCILTGQAFWGNPPAAIDIPGFGQLKQAPLGDSLGVALDFLKGVANLTPKDHAMEYLGDFATSINKHELAKPGGGGFKGQVVKAYLDGGNGNQEPFAGTFQSMEPHEVEMFMDSVVNRVRHKAKIAHPIEIQIISIAPMPGVKGHRITFRKDSPHPGPKYHSVMITQKDLLTCTFEACSKDISVTPDDPKKNMKVSPLLSVQEYLNLDKMTAAEVASHEHTWMKTKNGQIFCACGKAKVGSVFALNEQPEAVIIQESFLKEQLEKAMGIDSEIPDAVLTKAAEQFKKAMGAKIITAMPPDEQQVEILPDGSLKAVSGQVNIKIVGIDPASPEMDQTIALVTNDGKNFTLNLNDPLTPQVTKLGQIDVNSLKDGDAEECTCGNNYKMFVIRKEGNIVAVLASLTEQLIVVSVNPHNVGRIVSEKIENTDGSATYIMFAIDKMGVKNPIATAQRSKNSYVPSYDSHDKITSENAQLDNACMLVISEPNSGKPFMTISKTGEILVCEDAKMFFNDVEVVKAFAKKFWAALEGHNPLRSQLEGYKALAKKMMLKISELNAQHQRVLMDQKLVKTELPIQTRIRHIVEGGLE